VAKWATGRFAEFTFALAHRAKSQLVALGQQHNEDHSLLKRHNNKNQLFASFTAGGKVTFSRPFINQLLIHGHTRYIIDP
jgi:hypothetical protein